MLSVRSRDEGRGFGKERRKGLGFGGAGEMEESELEEGEACSYRDEDCGVHESDVDVELSYIDDRIQDVLGHFQKDFEGIVSVENLGAKFGDYGSFLPAHQRPPPILLQPGGSARVQHSSTPSQGDQPSESTRQNLTHQASASLPARSIPAPTSTQIVASMTSLDASVPKDPGAHVSMHCTAESSPKCEPVVKSSNGNGQSLKVRFKVQQENISARNNAAIYSGLGLDISPSSSLEDSLDYSGELSPDICEAPDESPNTILEVMTSLAIPNAPLLSPLSDVLLHLMEKEKLVHRDAKSGTGQKNGADAAAVFDLPSGKDLKGQKVKTIRPVDKPGKSKSNEVNHTSSAIEEKNISLIIKKESDVDPLDGRERVLDAPKPPLLATTRDKEKARKVGDKSGKPVEVMHMSDIPDEKGVVSLIMKEINIDTPEAIEEEEEEEEETKEVPASPGINRPGKIENEKVPVKEKLTFRTNLSEKLVEDQKELMFKDNAELRKDTKVKNDAKFNASKDFVQEIKCSSSFIDSPKHKSTERNLAYDTADQNAQEGKDCLVKKQKDSQSNRKSASDSSKEKSKSALFKHGKKGTHAGDNILETHLDLMGLKELNKRVDRDCENGPTRGIKNEHVESRLDSFNNYVMDETAVKHLERESYEHLGKPNERIGARRFETVSDIGVNGEAAAPIAANGLVSEADSDHWVCCDKCQKWRLHPEHISLPKKWICSMQSWLLGLNKCSVAEQEAINAFYALYRVQDHQNGLHAPICGTVSVAMPSYVHNEVQGHGPSLFSDGAIPINGKKKHTVKETQDGLSFTAPNSLPNTTKKSQQNYKSRTLNDVNQCPSDPTLLRKDGMVHVIKDHHSIHGKQKHKQKEKHKLLKKYSSGGDYLEQGLHSKSKSKRQSQLDNHKAAKKVKIDHLPYIDEENSGNEMRRKTSNGIPTKLTGGSAQMYDDDNKEYNNNFAKKLKDQAPYLLDSECKVNPGAISTTELENEISTKKRKMKEWQEIQEFGEGPIKKGHCSEVRDLAKEPESEHKQEKKIKSLKSDGRESSTSNARTESKGRITQVLLDGNGDAPFDGMEDGSRGIYEKESLRGNMVPKRISEGVDFLKKEVQHSAGAASSSSKVSGSRKMKANPQEVKGSPVESVSSSPLRVSSLDKSVSRKNLSGMDEVVNAGLNTGCSPRRSSDGEVDGGSSRSAIILKDKICSVEHTLQDVDKLAMSPVLDAHREACGSQGGDKKKWKPGHSLECCTNHLVNIIHELGQENQLAGGTMNKDNDLERKNYALANGSAQTRSEKGSSSRLKDKQLISKSDSGKGKFKSSDSCDEDHELYSTKNADDIIVNAHDGSMFHEEPRDDISRYKGKTKSSKDVNSLEIKDSVKCSSEKKRDVHSGIILHENSDIRGSLPSAKQQSDSITGKAKGIHNKDGRSGLQQTSQPLISREDKRSLSPSLPERTDRDLASAKGNAKSSSLSEDKQECPRDTFSSHVRTKVEGFSANASNGDGLKLLKQPKKPDGSITINNGNPRHPAVNGVMSREGDVRSPVRKENGHAAIKEAKDLKHSADRLKDGPELESMSLYFGAALKFLHGASLLEPNNMDVGKQGDDYSIHVYLDTVKLCEFCARFYEKRKDFAAAALTYKCIEVAYMRVIYLKHSHANRLRHELQAALPNLPGESPSSSASDVDNLNNPGIPEKALQVKGVGSPQKPCSVVINSRNRRSVDYLLNLATDVTSAMDALKKSQNAFAAASGSSGDAQYGPEDISSVREAIEFNFHDVERLLHLVRLAMEKISR